MMHQQQAVVKSLSDDYLTLAGGFVSFINSRYVVLGLSEFLYYMLVSFVGYFVFQLLFNFYRFSCRWVIKATAIPCSIHNHIGSVIPAIVQELCV